jgi:hypothetical protein
VRSNSLTVCVTDGADGFCGTTKPGAPPTTPTTPTSPTGPTAPTTPIGAQSILDTTAPIGLIAAIADHHTFAQGHGPRTLSGTAEDPGSGIDHVSLRLMRTFRNHCSTFLKSKALFAGVRCGTPNGVWFKVGANASWSYLLPAVLPAGRYSLDVRVTDHAGNHSTALDSGKERVVFTVR